MQTSERHGSWWRPPCLYFSRKRPDEFLDDLAEDVLGQRRRARERVERRAGDATEARPGLGGPARAEGARRALAPAGAADMRSEGLLSEQLCRGLYRH
jgi:hypothetical protein